MKSFESDIEMRRYLQGIKSIEGASDDPMAEIDIVEKPKRSSGPRRGKGRAIKMVLEAIRTGPRSLDEILQLANEGIEARTLEEGLTSLMEEGIVYRTKDAMYALVV